MGGHPPSQAFLARLRALLDCSLETRCIAPKHRFAVLDAMPHPSRPVEEV